ncbi:Uncharacterized membrane protein YgdD, TMEM256/DUF423 family [Terribacillus halophilus]|uniref:Uncharacterized membrane protein YgdD, TMEM256/DUF423 family n=1 Tax=Terribacillus halophilus TaxID=361279 RepID=A0A1G6I7H1_9BACI|nr:DUF423 domain-containing protein [Terribacillus halophilus]SDC02401.1 Uncharacterized membrane protein YgdD, TMEM256/DUF423 family [Terribacillus halophilus]
MKALLIIAAISGFLTVGLGAFGAHGLEGRLTEKAIATWEKAVLYQMFHTLALIGIALLLQKIQAGSLMTAGGFFIAGILLFSGTLYIYAVSGITVFALITPVGGVAFLIGWALLGYSAIKYL